MRCNNKVTFCLFNAGGNVDCLLLKQKCKLYKLNSTFRTEFVYLLFTISIYIMHMPEGKTMIESLTGNCLAGKLRGFFQIFSQFLEIFHMH